MDNLSGLAVSPFAGSVAECKVQQLVFLLVRQLTVAQFGAG